MMAKKSIKESSINRYKGFLFLLKLFYDQK